MVVREEDKGWTTSANFFFSETWLHSAERNGAKIVSLPGQVLEDRVLL
jgi:hypothetical protein